MKIHEDARRAARLYGAAATLRRALGVAMSDIERRHYERFVARARTLIALHVWDSSWAEGQAMPLEQAIAYALDAHAAHSER